MMKKILFVLISCLSTVMIGQIDSSTTNVLFKAKPLKVRGQFIFDYESSSVNKSSIHSIGLGFGLIFNKRIFIDLYGNISVNNPKKVSLGGNPVDPELANSLSFLDGGTRIGFKFKPYEAVHFAAILKFGTANIQSTVESVEFMSANTRTFTPQIEAELNLTRNIKLGIGVGYRFASRKHDFFKQNETNGFTFHTSFRFGRFAK